MKRLDFYIYKTDFKNMGVGDLTTMGGGKLRDHGSCAENA